MEVSGPQVLDAAKLMTAGGAAIFVIVQLVKGFGYTSPRATVAVAVLFSAALTMLYAISNSVFEAKYAFDLFVTAIGMAAAGAGINSAANASTRTT